MLGAEASRLLHIVRKGAIGVQYLAVVSVPISARLLPQLVKLLRLEVILSTLMRELLSDDISIIDEVVRCSHGSFLHQDPQVDFLNTILPLRIDSVFRLHWHEGGLKG